MNELMEPKFTMDPPPRFRMWGTAYLEQNAYPLTFTFRTRSQSCSLAVSTVPKTKAAALFTRISGPRRAGRRPKEAAA